MELGNLIFGHSRGNHPVPRTDAWREELLRLFSACKPEEDEFNRSYGVEFVNDMFEVHRYYWGDCTCGYEEAEAAWGEQNKHLPTCYQALCAARIEAYKREIGYSDAPLMDQTIEEVEPGVTFVSFEPRRDKAADRQRELLKRMHDRTDEIRQELCQELGLSYPNGSAVHCTCDFRQRWEEFTEANTHSPRCPIVLPNFWYKPTDFQLMWYKYPLRDSYMNQPLTHKQFRKIIDECIRSIESV